MAIAVTLVSSRSVLNPAQGRWEGHAILTVTGLSNGANNVHLTDDGTLTGAAILPVCTGPLEEPTYVPSDTTNLKGWAESAAPTVDANGNIVLAIFLDTGGPTSFRIGIVYPVPLS
jgi:hypothetical protein